jgi:superfamily I DNA/RNA helicase
LDLNKQGVKVITLKAAKGLKFPIVAIAGFLDATYPTIPKGTPEDEITEILARDRRTLFVGMTRAMRALLVIVPATNSSALLENFDKNVTISLETLILSSDYCQRSPAPNNG